MEKLERRRMKYSDGTKTSGEKSSLKYWSGAVP